MTTNERKVEGEEALFTLTCSKCKASSGAMTNETAKASGWRLGNGNKPFCPSCAAVRERASIQKLVRQHGEQRAARAILATRGLIDD